MDLDYYRKEIDSIDSELVRLLEKRMDIAKEIGNYKRQNNLPVFNGAREAEVIEKNVNLLENKDYTVIARKFFNNLMELSRSLQDDILLNKMELDINDVEHINSDKIGFQGVHGSFSEEALIKYFGSSENTKAYEEFEDVFIGIKNGEIDYGVLPLENSSTGGINQVYDLLKKYGFYIVGEQCIKIDQHLIGVNGATLESINEVYSHPQGFEQSRNFLKDKSCWKLIPFYNTAISAKMVCDLKDKSKAAIASKRAADIYGLEIIKKEINDERNNHTKFIVVGRNLEVNNECNKVSVIFSLEDEVGFLYNILRYFTENNINMMKIESRPTRNQPWKYLLYVDFEGNVECEEVRVALDLISKNSRSFKLLGNYKKSNC